MRVSHQSQCGLYHRTNLETCQITVVCSIKHFMAYYLATCGRRGGLMVSALVSGSSGLGSSPGRGHCVVFLGKTLDSHSASLHPGV